MGLAASRQEAFWEACGFGNIGRARHFLEEGDIDVNWVSYTNDCCPIHVASQGKPDIVQLLLEHNCNVNVRDNRGNLPIHHAAMKGHADIVQTLLDAGCEVNGQEKNGWTALHNAAYWCHPEVVRVLLKNGSDVRIQNKDERTALHECARSQNGDDKKLGEIAQILIDAGSDINSKSSDWGEADLTGLMYASFHNHPDVASALIKAGCELNSVGTTFWTALHWAADRGNDELVYILLDAGIDPTIRDMRGETAMDRAQTSDIREFIATAIDIHKELNRVKQPVIRPAVQLRRPEEPFKPKCDANFKSESFLPKDWKPTDPVNVKNLINEKKSRLAAMTSQKYRTELAKRTGTGVIKDNDVKKSGENKNVETLPIESSAEMVRTDAEYVCENRTEKKHSDSKCDIGVDSVLNENKVNIDGKSVSETEGETVGETEGETVGETEGETVGEKKDLNKDDVVTAFPDKSEDVEPDVENSTDKVRELVEQTNDLEDKEVTNSVTNVDGLIKDLQVGVVKEISQKCNNEIDREGNASEPSEMPKSDITLPVNAEIDGDKFPEDIDTQQKGDSLIPDAESGQSQTAANEKGDASHLDVSNK